MTMAGEGPAMGGKMAKYKSVTKDIDDNTFEMSMTITQGKDEHSFVVTYKRRKK
jgi:hypothetical protein